MTGRSPAFEPATGEITPKKRNSCKTIVVKNDRVLFTVNRDDEGEFLMLPGGGQRFGETLEAAAARETLEETGLRVHVRDLVLVREYIGANHEFAAGDGHAHQTEFFFRADPAGDDPGDAPPTELDAWQTGSAWIDPALLGSFRVYPKTLSSILPQILEGTYRGPLSLGDIN